MKITQITVSYGETQSLPEYSNTKPALTLTATLDPHDDSAWVEAVLWEQAKQSVQAQVDLALEANGKAAKYSTEPRYQILMTYWDRYGRPKDAPEPPKIVVILPQTIALKEVGGVRLVSCGNVSDSYKLRYAHALRVARQEAAERGATLLDCADGELMPLLAVLPPPLPPPSEEDAAGMRMADMMEDDRPDDDEENDDSEDDEEG